MNCLGSACRPIDSLEDFHARSFSPRVNWSWEWLHTNRWNRLANCDAATASSTGERPRGSLITGPHHSVIDANGYVSQERKRYFFVSPTSDIGFVMDVTKEMAQFRPFHGRKFRHINHRPTMIDQAEAGYCRSSAASIDATESIASLDSSSSCGQSVFVLQRTDVD